MKHTYRITVESLESDQKLSFETENHDDLFKIFEKTKSSKSFSENEGRSLILGLKLFSEVMLFHKSFKPFDVIRPVFPEFMKAFKAAMADQ
jgi:hypothetical protein